MPFVFAVILGLVFQQAPQGQFGTIEGIVTRGGTSAAPLAGATVKISSGPDRQPQTSTFSAEVTTDGTGRYSVPDVPSGNYAVEISLAGFGDRAMRVTVAAGQRARLPDVSLLMAGTIRGRVLDADGKGVASINVEILRQSSNAAGKKVWSLVASRMSTNDQGEYRAQVFGSGDYFIRAVLEAGTTHLAVYHPETLESSKAAAVILSEGSEAGADIRIGSASSGASFQISGKITWPSVNVASAFIQLALTQHDPNGPVEDYSTPYGQTTTRGNDGEAYFEFRGIRPGNYELSAHAGIDGGDYKGKVPIVVREQDLDGVELPLRPPVRIAGRIVVEGEPQNIQLLALPPTDRAFDPRPSAGVAANIVIRLSGDSGLDSYRTAPIIDPDGTSFSFREMPEGQYKLRATLASDETPAGKDLYIADIRAGGKSVIDSGFQVGLDPVNAIEIVVGTKGGTIEGRVVGAGPGRPVALVLLPETLFAGDPSFYRITELSGDASFRLTGIPPGKYKLFALPRPEESASYRVVAMISRNESRAVNVAVQKGKGSEGVEVPFLNPER